LFKVAQLFVNPEIPDELQKFSKDLVGYVIEKGTHKVIDVAVVNRRVLHEWYEKRTKKFDLVKYAFCVGSISLIGTIDGVQVTEVAEDEVLEVDPKDPTKKKVKYNYHVN
jgi:ribosomal protein S17